MAFKFGADVDHVQKFRALVAVVRGLDEKIDTNQLTPDEAWAGLQKYIADNKFPEPPAHVKEEQDKVKAEIKKAEADAKKAEAADKVGVR